MIGRIIKWLVILGLIAGFLATGVAALVGTYYYRRITRDMPKIERLNDYRPMAVTTLLADDGTMIAKIWDEYRLPVKLEEIPQQLKNAFLAAEDANFYKHPGIDLVSIARAAYKNFRNKASKQGASTITQQIVKSLLLSREKTYERKLKEAILSYKLEKYLSKDEIFTIYLNEIFLGANAYGVKAAAWMHFRKELKDLTLGETAFLAGLPPKPSFLSSPAGRTESLERRGYVLEQMHKNNMISLEQKAAANKEPLRVYPPDLDTIFQVPYYSSYALQQLEEKLKTIDKSWSPGNPGGFVVHTEVNIKTTAMAERALRRGLKEIDKRRGWRGPVGKVDDKTSSMFQEEVDEKVSVLVKDQIYKARVLEVSAKLSNAKVRVGDFLGTVSLKDSRWATRFRTAHDQVTEVDLIKVIKPSHIIEVSLADSKESEGEIKDLSKNVTFKIDQTPDIEGALTLINPLSGEVKVVLGGWDYSRSKFNRATQGLRQPGSAFKPIIYTSAIEYLNYTPATLVPDSPISLIAGNGQLWTPKNYDNEYLGPITLRTALQRSRNVVSVHLLQRIGLDRVINMARRFGITTPIGHDMSISLGTSEVLPIELTSAFGVFAAKGWLAERIVINKIEDRDGKVIYEQSPKQTQVIPEDTDFLMAYMMKGVVERGTAMSVKPLGHPVAGKTGTTNEQMDAWFIGYTPEWVSGVWVGFDTKKEIGGKETGGRVAAPIFLYFMQEFLANQMPIDFDIPDGVIPVPIDLLSGTSSSSPDAFIEYFKTGTEPNTENVDIKIPNDYLQNDEF